MDDWIGSRRLRGRESIPPYEEDCALGERVALAGSSGEALLWKFWRTTGSEAEPARDDVALHLVGA